MNFRKRFGLCEKINKKGLIVQLYFICQVGRTLRPLTLGGAKMGEAGE